MDFKNKKVLIPAIILLIIVVGFIVYQKYIQPQNPSGEPVSTAAVITSADTGSAVSEDSKTEAKTEAKTDARTEQASIKENGVYTSKEDVALYIHTFGKLPSNFITKDEAEALGWPGGSLEKYAPGKCIGGDKFSNREKLLPTAKGRTYTECDIDTLGAKSRGEKRIVFSNDGLIFYTDDHYESFTQLY